MKNLLIKIKPFEIYADPSERNEVIDEIMLYLEQASEENFFSAKVIEDEEETESDFDEEGEI